MLKVGLTGGIGSGKSTIANYFQNYGIQIIDADIIAHQLVEPKKPALLLIEKAFGKLILNSDDSLNRELLRDSIFTDPAKKKQLEAIMHPLIYDQMQYQFDQQNSTYCILCIPLLMETKMTSFVDRILVVDCSLESQIARVKSRDQLSTERIHSIINNQVSRKHRLSLADDVIDNSKPDSQLAEQVKKLHNQYLFLSNS